MLFVLLCVMFKKGLKLIVVAITVLLLFNCNAVWYGLQQGRGQLKIVWQAKPLNDFLEDENFPDSLKSKVRLVEDIKRFAFDSLGIKPIKNYTKMYDQKGKPGMYVVTACKPYNLKSYQWSFPFLGDFSYKGYFNVKKAKKEALKLADEGYDTDISEVNAWSTLGWFKDPVMSSMLKKTPGNLARLLIHELTHGTIFVKNNVQLNENLATFIGDKGAILFLRHHYGINSAELINHLQEHEDLDKIRHHLLIGAQELKRFYTDHLEDTITIIQKRAKINSIIFSMDTLSLNSYVRVENLKNRVDSLNNTFFSDFLMYREDQNALEIQFQNEFNGDFHYFFDHFKRKYATL